MKNKVKRFNYRLLILLVMLLLLLFTNGYFIYSLLCLVGIETLIRIVVIFILILLFICISLRYYINYKKKTKRFVIYTVLLIMYSILLILISNFIQNTLNTLNNLTSDKTIYSVSIVTRKEETNENIKNINEKVGILSNSSNTSETEIAKEIASENKINNLKEYDDYFSLIKALASGEVKYIFLPSNYALRFQNVDGLNLDLEKDTKIIYTKTKEITNQSSNKSLTEPFTILLMGVDSEAEDINGAAFNGDALMLITFNPKTLSTTILSIPRDSYVPIACFPNQKRNKITHAAWYGESCMIDTIQNFLDVKIDYYVKVNFKGVVKLVDTIGGIDVDIPYAFCEQNSNREWGRNTIYVEAGLQTINGEQALAFARNRHPNPSYCSSKWTNYVSNDFVRGQHQQEVLKAILNKLKSTADFNTVTSLLDTISNNLETNMSKTEILSLYNIGKDVLTKASGNVDELISMQRLYLSGVDAYIYDASSHLSLYDYVLYNESVSEVSNAMKENLGLKEKETIKTFSFDSQEKYEEKVIGKGNYSQLPDYKVIPDFTGDSKYQSGKTAARLGIKVSYVYDTESAGIVGTVIKQNYSPGTLASKVSSLVLTIKEAKEETVKKEPKVDDKAENKTNSEKKEKTDSKTDDKKETEKEVTIDDLLPQEE